MGYTLIASQVLSASAASVTFSSIPQTYKSLKLIVSARNDNTTSYATITFNSSSTSYSGRYLLGNGASASSGTVSANNAGDVDVSTNTASTFGSLSIDIPNYSGSTNKAFSIDVVTETNGATAYQEMWANLWSNTSAISSIVLASATNFVAGSSFYLYGIA